ncbi:hypothetical protein Nmel_005057 [Mimus melanotis]
MAARQSPPHRLRHPELRHSPTRDCQVLSPHPTSLSAPAAPPAASPRSAGPLWRSPHEQRFGPSPRTHPPVGRPRGRLHHRPAGKCLNIPAAAPPVSRTGAANGSAALPASPPGPPRSASCFLHTHLEMERNNRSGRHRAEGWTPLLEAAGSGARLRLRRFSGAGSDRKKNPKQLKEKKK